MHQHEHEHNKALQKCTLHAAFGLLEAVGEHTMTGEGARENQTSRMTGLTDDALGEWSARVDQRFEDKLLSDASLPKELSNTQTGHLTI